MGKKRLPENKERLSHIIKAIDEIFSFTKGMTLDGFKSDRKTLLAVEKLFEIIGEAAYKIDKEFKDNHPNIEWAAIEGTRHILVHNYYEVAPEILWNAKDLYLKDLKKDINKILSGL
jgi:uncharacterized protein with HEPN domain